MKAFLSKKDCKLKITVALLSMIIIFLVSFMIKNLILAKEDIAETESLNNGYNLGEKSKLSYNFLDQEHVDNNYSFFSIISRMKHIKRWNLFKNTREENLEEHSFEVAVIAHALACIKNEYFGGNIDCDRVAMLALFHDVTETIADDIPTPVKYYSNDMKSAYDEVEEAAKNELLESLPKELSKYYEPLLSHTEEENDLWYIGKAADRISALIKCTEERQLGNKDFLKAELVITKAIHDMNLEEAEYFLREFMPSYGFKDID